VARSVTSLAARSTALGAAVLALSLTVSSTAVAGSHHGDDTTSDAAATRVRIVTYNTEAKIKPSRAMQDLAALMAKDPDIITLQEMASPEKRQRIRARYIDCEGCVWGANMPGPPVPGETPVLYRTDRFELQDSGSVQVTEATYVGKAGAGPSTLNAKYVNWVRLRDLRTGRTVFVYNNHTVPSVQGKSGGPNRHAPKRLKLFRKHMTGLQDLVRDITAKHRGLVFVTGDLNVNYRRDRVLAPGMFPYRMLGAVGLEASYEAVRQPRTGTHTLPSGNDTRLIDYVYFQPRTSLKPSRQQIIQGLSSDHRPLMVDFEVTNATQSSSTGGS
jgi:endonuclease/exonuclease/phosphatase (EEP) superfamily protein YafD